MRHIRLSALPLFALALAIPACSTGDDVGAVGLATQAQSKVDPIEYPGNKKCSDLGYEGSFKVDASTGGTFSLDGYHSVTVTTDDYYLAWDSGDFGIDVVLMKGGENTNAYVYDPEETSDQGLVSPLNGGQNVPQISHYEFCFDYEVVVEKTANTNFSRDYDWSIDKSGDEDALTLSTGQTYTMGYDVVVSVSDYTDSGWGVSGSITVTNPSPFDATIESVTDSLEGTDIPVDCGVDFPYVLPKYSSLVCSYSSDLGSAATLTNTATATTSGKVGGGEGTAEVAFSDTPSDTVDACVNVDDTKYGALGTVCAGDSPATFSYTLDIGPYLACGPQQYDNTASFSSPDSDESGSDSWNVSIDVPCQTGCTLTQGYWKTHSENGPAPYDDNWASLESGAATAFFLSGQSYYDVLWTPPKGGNAYYILAHQYIAAELNVLNGADPTDAAAALAAAKTLLETYTPDYVGGLKGKKGYALRSQFTAAASTLDQYNNGLSGPGHCDE